LFPQNLFHPLGDSFIQPQNLYSTTFTAVFIGLTEENRIKIHEHPWGTKQKVLSERYHSDVTKTFFLADFLLNNAVLIAEGLKLQKT
ncbi:hypothetical protein, partial [Nitrosomonas sp. Is37]|uniref:hypothetical protein n=1 Tax=Nitrosomonas sp. Is37 TaxID=3080535 RepID=UPI00294B0324